MFQTSSRCVSVVAALTLMATTPVLAEDPRDPWEGYNRAMHSFNDGFDKALLKPAAKMYQAVTPEPVDRGISNFFSNLGEIRNFFACMLQGKPEEGGNSLARLLINSTVGVGGFLDVATDMGIRKSEEDFGQTFGSWGAEPGPYFVLPFVGPSTVRDAFGKPFDYATSPTTWLNGEAAMIGYSIDAVDTRADLMATEEAVEDITEDQYALMRDAYLDRREFLVNDGDASYEDYPLE